MKIIGYFCLVLACLNSLATSSRAQVFTTIHEFDATDGGGPDKSPLALGEDGNFYGTNSSGPNNGGTVFRITPQGTLTTLYSFCALPNCTDGQSPVGGLVLARDGNFYGTTVSGGLYGWGTVFKITPDGSFTTLHSFCAQQGNCADGASPYAGLAQAVNGKLYGTATGGGRNEHGIVFQITTDGKFRIIYSFRCCIGFGIYPRGKLIEGTDGSLYGTTAAGGSRKGGGTVFRIAPNGTFTSKNLPGGNGGGPQAGLLEASDGSFYGTTYESGRPGDGTTFNVTLHGSVTTLHTFCVDPDCPEGGRPEAELVQGTDGNFYGTTSEMGDPNCIDIATQGCGTVFKFTPANQGAVLHTFEATDGASPTSAVLQGTNGVFYGSTVAGGTNNAGTVFSLDMGLGPFVTFIQAAGKIGQTGAILGQGLTGTTGVLLNGVPASFVVVSDTLISVTVPVGATTGYVTVTTPSGTLTSNVPFHVLK